MQQYKLDEYQNIKLSLSRTYTMPQLKELAYYIYDDISEQSQGNPFLKPSDNNNLDIKWEVFPKNGELFSIGLYTKYIQNPISKALVGESLYSYLNIGDQAYVYGIEAEIRKDLWERDQYRIYTFANASYLQSKTDLNNDKIRGNSPFSVDFNKDSEQLEGAANFVANANVGIDYNLNASRGSKLNFVISYSYIGKHLYSIGTQGLGRVVEQPLNLLDAVLKLKLNDKISFGLKAKNLLNPKIERIQENQTPSVIYQYKNGTELGLGLSYQF
ncbi:TonB-dependent receptor domain-containing protein [Ornithobacterium rhinotracheale]